MKPFACAKISGSSNYPNLSGDAFFYEAPIMGIWVEVEVNGLPAVNQAGHSNFYGMHIHECGDSPSYDKIMNTGDLPPLLGNDCYAYSLFYSSRICADDVIGRAIVIHGSTDNLHSHHSSNTSIRIGCGIIKRY